MSRTIGLSFLMLVLCAVSSSWGADFASRESWRYGLGLGVNRSGDIAALEGASPRLTTYALADMQQATGLVAAVGFHKVYNIKVRDSRFEETQLAMASFGIENRTLINEGNQQAFSRLQAVYYGLNDQIFDDESALGFKLSVGMDFLLAENRDHWFGGDSSAAFFVMSELQLGLPTTSRGTNEAEVLNGLYLAVGIRNHF